jgi:rod shape-determining protein MreD
MDFSSPQIDKIFKSSIPVLSTLFFVLLNLAPWPLPILKHMLVPFVLMSICYWVINRPENFSMRWSFIFGVLQDLLSGQMLGVMAFSYLVADYVVRSQRQFFITQSFMYAWGGCAIAISATTALQWLIVFVFMKQPVDVTLLVVRSLMGVLLFPLMARLLNALQQRFMV